LATAIPALIIALGDEERPVATEAALGLEMDAITAIRTRVEEGQVMPAAEALARALSDRRSEVRVVAVRSLAPIGSKPEIAPPPALIAALRDDTSDEVRAAAATALGRFHTDVDDAIPASWFHGVRATQRAKDGSALDGLRAHQLHLVPSDRERAMPVDVRQRRNQLELSIAALRDQKGKLKEDEYYERLEKLMIELSRLYRDLPSGTHTH
jgi:hypothetical protein